jgi:hypothetical protein
LWAGGWGGGGGALSFGWSFFYLYGPYIIPVPAIIIVIEIGVAIAAFFTVVRFAGTTGNDVIRVYFVMGALAWYLPWDIVVTFALSDYFVIVVLVLVYYLMLRLRSHWLEVGNLTAAEPSLTGVSPGLGRSI